MGDGEVSLVRLAEHCRALDLRPTDVGEGALLCVLPHAHGPRPLVLALDAERQVVCFDLPALLQAPPQRRGTVAAVGMHVNYCSAPSVSICGTGSWPSGCACPTARPGSAAPSSSTASPRSAGPSTSTCRRCCARAGDAKKRRRSSASRCPRRSTSSSVGMPKARGRDATAGPAPAWRTQSVPSPTYPGCRLAGTPDAGAELRRPILGPPPRPARPCRALARGRPPAWWAATRPDVPCRGHPVLPARRARTQAGAPVLARGLDSAGESPARSQATQPRHGTRAGP